MKRTLHTLVKWCYLLTALAVILLAVLVQSGRSFSHVLGDYNQGIADYLSTKLNAQVQIGELQAEWDGLKPSLVIDRFHMQSPEGLPIVAVGQARMRFDILKSLRHLRLVWSNLSLTQVDMEFVQRDDGRWHIAGLPHQDNKPRADLNSLIDTLLLSTRMELQESHFRFKFTSGQQVQLDSPSVLLESARDFHRLALQIDVDEQPRSVYLILEGQGDPRKPASFRSKGYLQLNHFPTGEPIAAASAFLLGGTDKSPLQSEGSLDASIWFESRIDGQGYDLSGRLALQRLSVPVAERRILLDDFATELVGHWLPSGQWQLGLQSLKAVAQDDIIEAVNIGLESKGLGQPLALRMDRLDLARLGRVLARAGGIPEGALAEVLASLSPRGELRNLHLSLPVKSPADWQLRANLHQVAVGAWRGVPALTGVDGFISANRLGGFVDIDSRHGFTMHYIPTFDDPMDYERAQGQVAWHLQPENNRVYVNSGLLEFQKGDELARGYMWLQMPWRRNTGDLDLYLQIAGQNIDAKRYTTYVPETLPDSLRQWLAQSLGEDNPGKVQKAGFIYRGTLNKPNPTARTVQLALGMTGVALDYHAGWPSLSEIDGDLQVNDGLVAAQVRSARLLNSRVEQAQVSVGPRTQGPGSLLHVKGQVSGLAHDGIRVLREGQLRQYLGSSMDSWSLDGTLRARLDLDIPLGAETAEQPPADARQQVDVELLVSRLGLQNLNLEVNNLQGLIHYDNHTGIASRDLQGEFFGEPFTLSLASDKTPGASKTLIDLQGKVATEQLAQWSKRPETLFLEGVMPYELRVELNHQVGATASEDELPPLLSPREFAARSFARVSLRSPLEGVKIDLPAPYGKSAAESRPFHFQVWLQEQQTQIRVDYNQDVQALMRLDRINNNQLLNANIALAADARLGDKPQFLVSGFLPSIDIEAWKRVRSLYEAYAKRLQPAAIAVPLSAAEPPPLVAEEPAAIGTVAGLPFRADLLLGQYELGAMTLENLSVNAVPVSGGWQLAVKNTLVDGDLFVPESPFVPMDIALNRLSLNSHDLGLVPPDAPAAEETSTAAVPQPEEPVKVIDPRQLPRANIRVNSLLLDERDYGSWSLQLHPNPLGVTIDRIRGSIRGVTVAGVDDERLDEELRGAKLLWQNTPVGVQTRFIGRLSANDIGAVLREWQKPDSVESSQAQFTADLFWPGSPQDFKILNLGGEMNIAMEKGRFKRETSAGEGLLRLMSVLNFDSLARRLRFDFSDLYKSGLAYDTLTGKVRFNQGILVLEEPLVLVTPSSGMQMAGTIDMRRERLNTRLVASLPVAGNVTFYAALAAGLPAAVGIYVVSKLFKKQVDQATSVSYTIKGSWADPKMRFDRLFESEQSLRDSVKKNRAEKRPAKKTPTPARE